MKISKTEAIQKIINEYSVYKLTKSGELKCKLCYRILDTKNPEYLRGSAKRHILTQNHVKNAALKNGNIMGLKQSSEPNGYVPSLGTPKKGL